MHLLATTATCCASQAAPGWSRGHPTLDLNALRFGDAIDRLLFSAYDVTALVNQFLVHASVQLKVLRNGSSVDADAWAHVQRVLQHTVQVQETALVRAVGASLQQIRAAC